VGKAGGRGFILWFTGFGRRKSTLAEALKPRLEKARPVEILDGDEVRTHLSKGLGFSKEDRDTNIRRIGLSRARENGVVGIGAAICPTRPRDEVRGPRRKTVQFIEVRHATIDALSARDEGPLQEGALAGEIGNFTGVSTRTRRPSTRMLVRSDQESVDESSGAHSSVPGGLVEPAAGGMPAVVSASTEVFRRS
jgi:adenylylsulfate kinase-like enzyme